MLVVDKKPRELVTLDLGHGASAKAKVLDAFGHKLVLASARADLTALLEGEKPQHDWASITPDRVVQIRAAGDNGSGAAIGWMHAVLLATASIMSIDGVVDGEGKALEPSFELFELLFTDAMVESAFRLQVFKLEDLWAAEKNVSGPGPVGSGPEGSNGAGPAATPATPAPAEENAIDQTSSGTAAPSDPTLPAPQPEKSPGSSPAAAAPGEQPA